MHTDRTTRWYRTGKAIPALSSVAPLGVRFALKLTKAFPGGSSRCDRQHLTVWGEFHHSAFNCCAATLAGTFDRVASIFSAPLTSR
jgi:hypothetical protein